MKDLILERGPFARRIAGAVGVVGVPVAFLRSANDPFELPKFSLLVTVTAVLVAIRLVELAQGAPRTGLHLLAIPAGVVAATMGIAWLLGSYKGWALLGSYGRLQGFIPYLVVALFGWMLADSFAGRPRELAHLFLWSGAIVGAYAVIQTIGLDPFRWNLQGAPTTAISTIGNPNFTGGFLGIVLPVGAGMLLSDGDQRTRIVRLLVPALAGWLVARSQGGWAAGIAGTAVVIGFHARPRWRAAHIAGALVAAAVIAVTIGVVAINLIRPESRFAVASFALRAGWWTAAFDMFVSSPLFGSGPDSFAVDGISHRTIADALGFNFDFANDPHSVPLAMLANAGLLGLAALFVPIGWAARRAWGNRDTPAIWFLGGIVAYVTQALVSIDELSLRVALWTCVAGAVGAHVRPDPERSPGKRRKRRPIRRGGPIERWPAVIGATLLLVVSLSWAIALVIADTTMRSALSSVAREPERALDRYETALRINGSPDYRGRMAITLSSLAGREEYEASERAFYAEQAQQEFGFVEELPYVFSIVEYARLLDRSSDGAGDPKAVDLYVMAMDRDPLNPLLKAEAAAAMVRVGEYRRALDTLEPQMEIVTAEAYPSFWASVAAAAAEAGDLDLAEQAVEMVEATGTGGEMLERAIEILEGP